MGDDEHMIKGVAKFAVSSIDPPPPARHDPALKIKMYIKCSDEQLQYFCFFCVVVVIFLQLRLDRYVAMDSHSYLRPIDGEHLDKSLKSALQLKSCDIAKDNYNLSQRIMRTNFSCSQKKSRVKVEDILCMKSKQFLPQFKNPCWFDNLPSKTFRCFPYFYVFGVCKSGTTDLFRRLTRHPQILDNKGILGKETWYWSRKRYGEKAENGEKMTLADYADLFKVDRILNSTRTLKDQTSLSNTITGHADPMDFWEHHNWKMIPQNDPTADEPRYLTPDLVHHVTPNIKLILMLREPTERLYSHYFHAKKGTTPEDFHHHVIFDLEIFSTCTSLFSVKDCLYTKHISKDLTTTISPSLYYVHLAEWMRVFPLEQIYILRTEDYSKDIRQTLKSLFSFLDVDELEEDTLSTIGNLSRKFESVKKREAGAMYRKTKVILLNFFREYNCKLAELLGDKKYLWDDSSSSQLNVDIEPQTRNETLRERKIRRKWSNLKTKYKYMNKL